MSSSPASPASTEIRSKTYSNLSSFCEFSSNKWMPPNDDVFNKLAEMLSEKEQEMISDFLNLFYYFIVCYSKKCFKKNGIWQHSRHKLSQEAIKFNYELANENESHNKILDIQRRMYKYRQEFKYAIDNKKAYFIDDKTREIELFIRESLDIICSDIQEPVIFTSYDIKTKVAKYTTNLKERNKHKKSQNLNYTVLEALGINVS